MPKLINLQGHVYGQFTVICRDPVKPPGKVYWICRCACGTIKSIVAANLRNGNSTSCGSCLYKGNMHPSWTGHGELPGVLWKDLQHGASRRNILFEVTIEQAWELFMVQNRKCALSGVPLQFGSRNLKGNASLDRIDNSIGYVEGNIQWVHKMINRVKMDYSQEDFIKMCKEVANFNE